MISRHLTIGIFYLVASVACFAETLADVKKLHVGSMGSGEGSEVIRKKLADLLAKSEKVTLTDSPDAADAVLTGEGETSIRTSTGYDANLSVRLIGRSKQVLWTDRVVPSFFGSASATSNVANQVAKNLVKALEQSQPKQAAAPAPKAKAVSAPATKAEVVSTPEPKAETGAVPDPKSADLAEQLQKLADLHAKGLLTDEEFKAAKKKLLK